MKLKRIYKNNILIVKKCSKCNEYKYVDNFSKSKSLKDGLLSECKNCRNLRNRERYSNNKDFYKKYHKEKYEENKNYYKSYYKEYYQVNKEHYKEYKKEYRNSEKGKLINIKKAHKYKSLKRSNGGSYTNDEYNTMLSFFNYRCAYTGEILTKDNLHIDHIVPISKGGTSYIYNLVPSINYANMSKHNSDMEEWYIEQPYFSKDRLNKIYEWINLNKGKLK